MKIFNKSLVITILVASFVFGLVGQAVFAAGPATVNLGTAGNFVILSKTGISTTGTTSVVGDIGVSPAAASYITGFLLNLPSASAFSTSSIVTGKVYAPGYADSTPTNLTTAVLDMQTAYTDASGRPFPTTELAGGNIGGLTLLAGIYKWNTNVTIATDLTLEGGANDVWIFQVAGNLDIGSAKKIILAKGAKASNIFWAVAEQVTLGTTSVFNGNILSQTAIVLNTGSQLNGRALAQTAVTLDSNTVIVPSSDSGSPTPSMTPTPTPTPSTNSGNTSTSTPTPSPSVSVSPTPSPTIKPTPTSLGFTNLSALNLNEGNTISAAGSDDPDIYIVNDWGYKRLFLNPIIFGFYGHLGGFANVKTIIPSTRNTLATSGLVRNCETNDLKVYGIETTGEDAGILHWVNTSGAQAVQDDPDFFKKVFCINSLEFNWYTQGSNYTSVNQVPSYSR